MSALGDVIVDALKELLRLLFEPIEAVIQNQGQQLVRTLIGTPYPNETFGQPTNPPWPAIYEYYWDVIVPLAILLWALAIGLVIFLESTSHLFGGYHRSKLKKRAFSGLLGILSWWWIAALSLRFFDALADLIAPDLSTISLFETLSFSGMGVLGLVVTLATDFTLFVLIGLIYFTRHVVLYLFVLLMPILIACWIPGVGPFRLSSQFVKRLSGFYVPFLAMTVPVAVLFQLGKLLGHSFGFSTVGIGAWLTALIIPVLAVVSPLLLFWQAGSLFFMAGRFSRRVSTRRARERTGSIQDTAARAVQASRDLRGGGERTSGGTPATDSGGSRASLGHLDVQTAGEQQGEQQNPAGRADREQSSARARTESFEHLRAGDRAGDAGHSTPPSDSATSDSHPRNRDIYQREEDP